MSHPARTIIPMVAALQQPVYERLVTVYPGIRFAVLTRVGSLLGTRVAGRFGGLACASG